MKIVKTVLQFFIVLLCIYSCLSQSGSAVSPVDACRLRFTDSPAMQGYKLGMDLSEVDPNQIAGKAGDNNETYIKTVNSNSTCYLTFENKKLKTVTVLYKLLKFDSVDAFVSYINKTFDLPDTWLRQTPKQIEIENQMLDLEQQLATVVA